MASDCGRDFLTPTQRRERMRRIFTTPRFLMYVLQRKRNSVGISGTDQPDMPFPLRTCFVYDGAYTALSPKEVICQVMIS